MCILLRLPTPILLAVATLMALARESRCADTSEPKSGLHASAGGVQYYLSLPKRWTTNSTWPILVSIDGAGHNFLGNFQAFTKARGEQPFIIMTPFISSNGNDPADLKAVLVIVQEVQKSAKGQPKFFITGFSAGGHLAWQCIFTHPELLAGAAPAAANFRFRGVADISKAPERVKLPIHGFLGDNDAFRPALTQQWEDAIKLARQNGFENLALTEVPGKGHQAFPDQVVAFFASLLTKHDRGSGKAGL
jgi:dienelactone hydrolase